MGNLETTREMSVTFVEAGGFMYGALGTKFWFCLWVWLEAAAEFGILPYEYFT